MMKKKRSICTIFSIAAIMLIAGIFSAIGAFAATDTTNPTISWVSPANNQEDLARAEVVTVRFSEQMNTQTINTNTFTVTQRTTPDSGSPTQDYRSRVIDGKVTSDGYTATFTPTNPLTPNQEFGNVFTVTLTSAIKDISGNALSRDYVWSFTTGAAAFNTDGSTSQSDQSQNANGLAPIVPVGTQTQTTPAATATTEENNSAFPWLWVIGGILVVLAILAFLMLPIRDKSPSKAKGVTTMTEKNTPVAAKKSSNPTDPFGDVHPVLDLEGIGPEYNDRLQAMGIKDTRQLWKANAAQVAKSIGVSTHTVKSWQNMAELASVNGIGPQYSELLERSGIHTIEQLKKADPDKLLAQLRKKQNSLKINIQGNNPGNALVENWIKEAQAHKGDLRETAST